MLKKKVLITGCKGGIGLDAAQRLAKNGHTVYATVHREESIDELQKAFTPNGDNVVIEKLDITDAADREKAVAWNIDVLINNAAIGDSGSLAEIDIDIIKTVFETNVFSTLKLTQEILPAMIKKKAGRIIFVGSMAGLMPTPFLAPYGMTKFCIESIVYSLRTELKPFKIDVTVVNPGAFKTGFNWKMMKKKYDRMNIVRLDDKKPKYGCFDIKKTEHNILDNNPKYDGFYKDVELVNYMATKDCDVLRYEEKSTDKIANEIVKAVEDSNLKRRYYAPLLHWIGLPIKRRTG